MLKLCLLLLINAVGSCPINVGSETYDLSYLDTAGTAGVLTVTPPPEEEGSFLYKASFCSDKVSCQGVDGMLARESESSSCLGMYGKWSTALSEKTKYGFQTTFTSTMYCTDDFGLKYESVFNYLCDEASGNLGKIEAKKTGVNTCEYTVDIYTALVCSGSLPVPTASHISGGLSGGSIFLIILSSLLSFYVLMGLGWSYHKERTFMTPHRQFWCSQLPVWTKAGCLTSWLWTKNCYILCCMKLFNAKREDERMITGLIGDHGAD